MNLNQVTLPVSDVQRSISYFESLGLRLIVKALPHYARFECPDGDATFSLHREEHFSTGNGTWIYFEVADVDSTVAKLREKEIAIEQMPENKPWLWREARLKDPDGNLLIIYHAGKNRKEPPWRI